MADQDRIGARIAVIRKTRGLTGRELASRAHVSYSLLAKVEYLLADDGNWRAVELIAAELLKLGVISGRATKHLFEQACAE